MPLKFRNKKTKEIAAEGVPGDSIMCGHCGMPILDGARWVALDDPYFCLVHSACVNTFEFNNISRSLESIGRETAIKEFDKSFDILSNMLKKPFWQRKAVAQYHKAIRDILVKHETLKAARLFGWTERPMEVGAKELKKLQSEAHDFSMPL